MTDTLEFTLGAEVSCSDGHCGEVSRLVVDPVARAVTHLVVDPKHGHALGRLVPLELVDPATSEPELELRCTRAEFDKLEPAEETQFLPTPDSYPGYGTDRVMAWPYYGLRGGMGYDQWNAAQPVTNDTVPLGEVSIRRHEPVRATDGDIGHIQGLVIDPGNHHVTHVLLQEGHLWGRKEVAIPIGAVSRVETGIQVSFTKQQIGDLPVVDVDGPVGP
jgi:sporulation protein YlmC with PRC-barrel domain